MSINNCILKLLNLKEKAVTLSPQATISEGNGSKTTPYIVGEKITNRTIS